MVMIIWRLTLSPQNTHSNISLLHYQSGPSPLFVSITDQSITHLIFQSLDIKGNPHVGA